MYSPKIKEELVPILYRIASSKKIPMTKLVNQIIAAYLDEKELTDADHLVPKQLEKVEVL